MQEKISQHQKRSLGFKFEQKWQKIGFDEGYFRKGRAIGMTMPKKESACKRFFLHLKEYRQ